MLPSVTVMDARRAVSRHRSLLAAGLAAGSLAAALNVLAPHAPPGVPVLTADRDLPGGTSLTAHDLRVVRLPRALVPAGSLDSASAVVGRVLAAPLRRGEALTDIRLAGADLLTTQADGVVAVPVRVADAASAALVTAGDRVDVLAVGSAPGASPAARVVARDAEVLAVPTAVQDDGDGALIVVAATPSVAAGLAAAAVSSRLSLTLRART
ncbi:MAG: pilus assembly protein CpaB [Actinomycetota bacterium]|nr:pilus assembly protein CpaB [Actinomycetota bacterium]